MRFFSTVELVNALELEKTTGRAGQIANRLMHVDLVILDEVGYLPFAEQASADVRTVPTIGAAALDHMKREH